MSSTRDDDEVKSREWYCLMRVEGRGNEPDMYPWAEVPDEFESIEPLESFYLPREWQCVKFNEPLTAIEAKTCMDLVFKNATFSWFTDPHEFAILESEGQGTLQDAHYRRPRRKEIPDEEAKEGGLEVEPVGEYVDELGYQHAADEETAALFDEYGNPEEYDIEGQTQPYPDEREMDEYDPDDEYKNDNM